MTIHHLIGRWEKRPAARCLNGQSISTADAPRIATILACERLDISGPIDFLIDSGADRTIIMPDDCEALGVRISDLQEGCPNISKGVGGWCVPIKYLDGVTLEFLTPDNGLTETLILERIAVLSPSRKERRNGHFNGLPSLLGRSFLGLCHVDLTKEGVFLHYEGE